MIMTERRALSLDLFVRSYYSFVYYRAFHGFRQAKFAYGG